MTAKKAVDIFPLWLKQAGMASIGRRLKMSRAIVSEWYWRRSVPRPERAYMLIEMSGGYLTWESIYKPFAVQRLRRK